MTGGNQLCDAFGFDELGWPGRRTWRERSSLEGAEGAIHPRKLSGSRTVQGRQRCVGDPAGESDDLQEA